MSQQPESPEQPVQPQPPEQPVQPQPPERSRPSAGGAVRDRPRVAVVFGGRSSEHSVSCVSAGSVLRALDPARYDVLPVGIARDGRWVLASTAPGRLEIAAGRLPEVDPCAVDVVLAGDSSRQLTVLAPGQPPQALGAIDVVFPVLHGPYGEDGTLQGLLEMAGVPYVGSGVFASAAAMDKGHMKALLANAGLPIGRYELITPRQWRSARAETLDRLATLGFPMFVKPARAGSSMGVSRVSDLEALADAVEMAREHDPRVVVEAAVPGRELECGVLESLTGGPPETSVVGEIRVTGGQAFYDFEAKYLDDATELDVPADLPEPLSRQVRQMAATAFEALGCEGLARVDFFLRPDGSVLVNEVNTMPGFTPVSMFPLLWSASGLDYPALVTRLVDTALARRPGLR